MSAYRLQQMFQPKRIVLVGASDRPLALGNTITRNLLEQATDVAIDLVNPSHDQVLGRHCVRKISQLEQAPDLALIMSPWPSVQGVLHELAELGTAGAVICSVADSQQRFWSSARSELKRLERFVAESGMRVIGPSSQGLLLPNSNIRSALCPAQPLAGQVALISQSGAMLNAVASWAQNQGLGLSLAVALGDGVDVDVADCLDYLSGDRGTRAVLVHIESVYHARKFFSALRECSFRKPVIVLRPTSVNAAEQEGFDDETNDCVYTALLTRGGALRVRGLPQFFAAANAEFTGWTAMAERVAVVGNGFSLGALTVDAVHRYGARLSRLSGAIRDELAQLLNTDEPTRLPLDLKRDADPLRYADAVRVLASDPEVEAILVTHQPTLYCQADELAQALAATGPLKARVMAVFVAGVPSEARHALHSAGIPAFDSPEQAMRAHAMHCLYRRQKELLRETPPARPPSNSGNWSRVEQLFERIASKPSSAGLWPALISAAGIPGVAIEGCSSDGGLQLLLRQHPQIGALIEVRLGNASQFELPPINLLHAQRLLSGIDPQLDSQPEFMALLADCLLTLSDLACRYPTLHSLQLAPRMLADIAGLTVLVHGELTTDATAPLAIRPCPEDYDEMLTLDDGQRLLLRPIRAEDEPELQAGFMRLSAEEIRLRFLYPLKTMTHELASKLTQIDYEREMALVLAEPGDAGRSELYGVVRAVLEPAYRRAEYAIVIHRSLAGKGLGRHLMTRIIEWCRERVMVEVYGEVLAENRAMLHLCRKLGFSVTADDEDPGTVHVSLLLNASKH